MRRAMAQVVAADAAGIAKAGEVLRSGGNAAFPTETVYGLGGSALDEAALMRIFTLKGRPLTDPLIVHVRDAAAARALVNASGATLAVFDALAARFWPGPLTMVLEAQESLPKIVTAGTGMVGVRCPAHPVAQQLLAAAGVPVAAPSANRFGHVSPTSAQHVLDDLGDKDITVVDGGDVRQGACGVGIESTVLKVAVKDEALPRLVLFRKGGVPEAALREALDAAGLHQVLIVPPGGDVDKGAAEAGKAAEAAEASKEGEAAEEQGQEAPGQAVTHYAPDVETWLLESCAGDAEAATSVAVGEKRLALSTCAVLDFGGRLAAARGRCKAYRDLSEAGSAEEAARSIFEALRWTETTAADHVVIVQLPESSGPMAAAVADRMFRAASGRAGPGSLE